MKNAIYPLSADPFHNGHLHILMDALETFDHIIVAIGNNAAKKYCFTLDERVALTKKATEHLSSVEVKGFDGLLGHFAYDCGINTIIRGYRTGEDATAEKFLSDFNRRYGLRTWTIPAAPEHNEQSSTIVKSAAQEGCFVDSYVHAAVKDALEQRLLGVKLIGVTGNMGVGKTTLCKAAEQYGLHSLHVDDMVQEVYTQPGIIEKIIDTLALNGTQDIRSQLTQKVFSSGVVRDQLKEILHFGMLRKLEGALHSTKGVLLLECAYLVEYDLLPKVNYMVIDIDCDVDTRSKRIEQREGVSASEFCNRLDIQLPAQSRREKIKDVQRNAHYGSLLEMDSARLSMDENAKRMAEFAQQQIKWVRR